jgi:hypothetical protein
MENLLDFALQERHRRVSELGDKVAEFDTLIKWELVLPHQEEPDGEPGRNGEPTGLGS